MFFSIVHTGAHLFNLLNSSLLARTDSWATIILMWTTYAGVTGVVIFLAFFLLYTSAVSEKIRRAKFELFWYIHLIMALIYFPLLILHGYGCFLKDDDGHCLTFQSWKFVMAGMILYFLERFFRFMIYGLSQVPVLKVISHPSRVFEIQFPKGNINPHVGQYVLINCPELAVFEWHPFTLTSAPQEDYISVHIRVAGDWSEELAKMLGMTSEYKEKKKEKMEERLESLDDFEEQSLEEVHVHKNLYEPSYHQYTTNKNDPNVLKGKKEGKV
jgi:NADPH oxidase